MRDSKSSKSAVLNVLYTKRCKYCREVIDIRQELCDKCAEGLPIITGKTCRKCGLPANECNCTSDIRLYRAVSAPFYYEGSVKKFIKEFKFNEGYYLAPVLAQDMADNFNLKFGGYEFEVCTYVPAHRKDKRSRGYNQSELLAKAFCEITGIQCSELLVKTRRTPSQHSLNRLLRSGNLAGAIKAKEGIDVKGCRVLLIDDIKTTGSTLNECAKMLLLAGAAEVFCLTGAIKK